MLCKGPGIGSWSADTDSSLLTNLYRRQKTYLKFQINFEHWGGKRKNVRENDHATTNVRRLGSVKIVRLKIW